VNRKKAAMLEVDIPSRGGVRLEYLVLDVNGTIALDGQLIPTVHERLGRLSKKLDLWLVSADTQGTLTELATALQAKARRLQSGDEVAQKAALVDELGAERVVAVGNGANDAAMLQRAALGIAVLGGEGLATACLATADVVAPNIEAALDLLLYPRRLIATLRT
jgi:P-type E1-E2 ATPase